MPAPSESDATDPVDGTTSASHLLAWHLRTDADWDAHLAGALHEYRSDEKMSETGRGRSVGLLFFNPSLRTRTSMELGAVQLGAHATTLTPGQGTWGFEWEDGVVMNGDKAEHIRDAVAVLSQYYDALGVRVFATMEDYARDRDEVLLNQFAEAAQVPVVNLESAFYHPCQALADAATLHTHFDGDLAGRRLVLQWAYHPRALPMAVPNSALLMASRLGMDVTVARPEGYALDDGVMAQARQYAAKHGTTVDESDDIDAAVDGADVVYAKAWGGPMAWHDPEQEATLRARHRDWRVTADRMARTRDGVFMHCLPVRRNVVVDDAVLDGPSTLHLLQAAFRLHGQKAILRRLWSAT